MSNQKNKNKDKDNSNVRISENDIQRKLYGGYSPPKNKDKEIKGKFSEDIIKNKLYGGISQPEKETVKKTEPVPVESNDLFSEKKSEQPKTVQQKNGQIKQETSKASESKITAEEPEIKILPVFQDEINALKQAIANLEDKLQRTELQKHKLKVKLVQKRKLINIREGLADLILNKMPEKFILLFFLIFIMFLLIMFVQFKPKQIADKKQPSKIVQPEQFLKSKPVKPAEKNSIQQISSQPKTQSTEPVRRYTIQVAEYADEQAAMTFIKDLEAKGFQVFLNTIYRGPNNTRPYFKINVGSFDTFNEAKQYNQKLREKTNINDSFIRESK